MASYTFLYAAAFVLAVASASDFMVMSSPEPEMDPMVPVMPPMPAKYGLYIVSTGSSMVPMMRLKKRYNRICPDDYPTGFSVLCVSKRKAKKARFYVNRKLVKVERKMPYFIAGNNKMRVKSWMDYPKKAKIICKLRFARRKKGRKTKKIRAKVKFMC